jgi:hypothetical protein
MCKKRLKTGLNWRIFTGYAEETDEEPGVNLDVGPLPWSSP